MSLPEYLAAPNSRSIAAAFAIACTLFALPAAGDTPASAGPKYFKMKQVQIIDPAGLGKPVPAADLLIPTDWKFQSDVRWANRGCFTDLAAITFQAQSPDGKLVVEAFPSFSWQYATDPSVQRYLQMENQAGAKVGLKPCPVHAPVHAADVLRQVVLPQHRPGKDPGTIEPIADLNQFMTGQAKTVEAQASRAGQPVQMRAEAARARLKYDLDGQPVEEWITVVSVAQATSISSGSGTTQGVDCRAIMLFAMRAPAGQLDANEKLFNAIRSSLHMEPAWQQQYLAMVTKLSSVQQSQRQTRAQLIQQFQQREISTINSVTANGQRGANQAFVGADQLVRQVEPYRDPTTGKTVELSYMYGNAWSNGNNEYVLSTDPNFNPKSALDGNWTPMEHVQPTP